ncbi:MAG: folylpolyglutamate synthase [Pseudomonadota bacterium]
MLFPSWPNPNKQFINLGLERISELLVRLNNPQHNLPPVVHIAGTNGKGSTLAFIKSILQTAGYRVHSYTSPHLIEFNERIELANKMIDDDFLTQVSHECRIASLKDQPIDLSFFEGTTAMAFLAFSKIKADILLLETGLGGEFDATNVVEQVLASIITTIDFDHQEYLGKTLKEIAKAKAGIIKKDCLTISTNQHQEVIEVIENQAKKLNSNLIYANHIEFNFDNIELGLQGQHQLQNAQLAVSFIKNQKLFKISDQQIKIGLQNAQWRGRLERINDPKILKLLPNNCQFYIDGSHNLQGANTVNNFLKKFKDKKITLIFSMLKDKPCEEFLSTIINSKDYQISEIILTTIPNQDRSMSLEELEKIIKKFNVKYFCLANYQQIFEKINHLQSQVAVLTGSLYLVGDFLVKSLTKDFE